MIDGLKPYPEYKETGLPWLGRAPTHWETRRMKVLFSERHEKGHPSEPLLAATQTMGVVRKEDYGERTVTAQKDFHLLKLVEPNDFVVSLRSFQGGIEYARCRGIISPAYTILTPRKNTGRGYYSHYLKSRPFVESLTLFVTGIRQGQNIDYPRLLRAHMPFPPRPEQDAIGRFLSHASGKIERAIQAKRKLVALLNEQKQAVIHRAVTRGLDPPVKLKPSGIPWLGDVPEHWTVSSLRFRYHQCLGKMVDAKKVTGRHSIPYLRNVDVRWGYINTADLPLIDIAPHERERYTMQIGDLLVCEGRHLGRCAFWRGELEVCGFQKALHRLRPLNASTDDPRFMYYTMIIANATDAFHRNKIDNSIPHLTGEMLRAHRFAFPPKNEQAAISDYLETLLKNNETLLVRAEREIALLREYRTTLTADVVTGKLDVRAAAAGLPDEAEEPPSSDAEETAELETDGPEDGA